MFNTIFIRDVPCVWSIPVATRNFSFSTSSPVINVLNRKFQISETFKENFEFILTNEQIEYYRFFNIFNFKFFFKFKCGPRIKLKKQFLGTNLFIVITWLLGMILARKNGVQWEFKDPIRNLMWIGGVSYIVIVWKQTISSSRVNE